MATVPVGLVAPRGPPPPDWQLWLAGPSRSWPRRHPVLVGLLVVLAIIVGLGAVATTMAPQQDTTSPTREKVEDALGATGHVSDHDGNVVAGLGKFSRSWNAAAAPFIANYQDPNVSAEDWVAGAADQVAAMRAALRGLNAAVLTISDDGLREVFTPMVENYQDKLAAAVALWNAVADGDQAGESQAGQGLAEAVAAGQAMAKALLERVRPLMTPEQFDELAARPDGT